MVQLTRRSFAALTVAGALGGFRVPAFAAAPPMARVILDNDFSGDPDGLFQLAQHLLSPSVDIPLIVGSHLPDSSGFPNSGHTASEAAAKVHDLLDVMGRSDSVPVLAGSNIGIVTRGNHDPSPATAAIVALAMREDAAGPLVYAAGAGLTELALAWIAEPRIGPRLKLIWIGGQEHPGLAYPPPGADAMEFNQSIDPLAAQIIFNQSDIDIWQVPRNAYRQMLFSNAELRELERSGPLGRYLVGEITALAGMIERIMPDYPFPRSETYILGDSPLVTLTALQSFFQPDPSSSLYALRPTPRINAAGAYEENPAGRPMRVYTQIDTRLTFADMMAKFREAGA